MKISQNWLQSWVSADLKSLDLSALLTNLGLEVAAIEPVVERFFGVVVAYVEQVEKHPDADKLNICQVRIDSGQLHQVVCGASNVRAGIYVPFATVGACLAGGFKIKKAKLRGVESSGMICSESELGLCEKSVGIMVLPPKNTDDNQTVEECLGSDVFDFLSLDDQVIEIELTPNRGDCLSACGIAREVAAKTNSQLKSVALQEVPIDHSIHVPKVAVLQPELSPVYCVQKITGVDNTKATPLWMQERLRRADIQPVSLLVDITQYVMLELGQPLHAFDAGQIGDQMQVRYAKTQESITLINGKQHLLTADTLVISDAKKPLAIAGVMGSEDSGVSAKTSDVILESAHFNPDAMAGIARRYGLATDASQRFERGVDPELPQIALQRAVMLVVELAGGAVGKARCYQSLMTNRQPISLRAKRVGDLLGVTVSADKIVEILSVLNMNCIAVKDGWEVTPPSYRFDINIEADLIEEVIRLLGYAHLQPSMPAAHLNPVLNNTDDLNVMMVETMVGLGFFETINYSFIDEKWTSFMQHDSASVRLKNPLASAMSTMRQSLWPGLIDSALANLKRQRKQVRLFEIGQVFSNVDKIVESLQLAGLSYGELAPWQWDESERKVTDFYHLKQDVLTVADRLGWTVVFEAGEHPLLHPGKTARLIVGENVVGWIGMLHPQLQQQWKLSHPLGLFSLDLSMSQAPLVPKYQFSAVSKFPSVRRDLALVMPKSLNVAQVQAEIVASSSQPVLAEQEKAESDRKLLKNVYVFDIYEGEHLECDQKSVAVALIFQHPDRTLMEEEVQRVVDQVVCQLRQRFSIALR